MKHLIRATLVAILMAAFAGVAAAHPDRFDRREARQDLRVRHGIRTGQLTRAEVRRLNAMERRIHRVERRAWRDGRLDRCERRLLDRSYDRRSRAIHRLKHNRRSI